MEKKLIVLAVLFAVSSLSYAQSNLTLYGSLSTGLGFVSNEHGGRAYPTDDSLYIPSFWGVRGSEDLGGGLKAVFDLASVFLVSSGKTPVPGQLFKFDSYVGLDSNRYGRLTFGNQWTFDFTYLGPFSNQYAAGSFYAAHPGNIDELANLYQWQNSVKYVSPDYKGLTAAASLGLGGQAGNFANGRTYGFAVHYTQGSLTAAATYESENNRYLEGASFIGLPQLFGTPITPGTALVVDNVRNWGAGTSYQIGPVTVRGLFTQTHLTQGAESATINSGDIGAMLQTSPFNFVNAGAGMSKLAGGRWTTLILNDSYHLSKRTTVYGTLTCQMASGNGAVASMDGAQPASGHHQIGVGVGTQHWF